MPAYKLDAAEQAALPVSTDQPQTTLHPTAEGFAPLAALQTSLRLWWVLAAFIVLGGLAGWSFRMVRPPLYEAVTTFSVGIDFVQTGNMTQYEEDVAINAVVDLLVSDAVVNEVANRASAEGLELDNQAIRGMSVAEHRLNALDVRIHHTDIDLAERVAQLWMEAGWETLREAYQHAVKAEQFDRYIHSMQTCLEKAVVIEPAQTVCGDMRFEDVTKSLFDAGNALAAERDASRGLFAGLRLGEAESPVVSGNPVRHGLGQSTLAGSLLGLLIGLVVLHSGLLKRWVQ